jgi:hypothetical protein
MKRRGLLDAEPSGQVTAPRRTSVRGTPHHLAYITAQEAALLRARGGGLTRDGRPLRGPAGLPAFDNSGDGGDGAGDGAGADGADGSGAGAADGHGDSGAADGHGNSSAADGHSNSSGPDGTSDGNGGNGDHGGYGLANYLGSLLPQGPDPRAAQRDAWRSALTAPIDQAPRNFVAGGAMPGAPQAPVAAYNYGAFPAAPPAIGALQPLPAAPAPGNPPANGGGLPPVPNLGLPSYAPPRYGMQPATLARLQQVGVMPRYGAVGLAGSPDFNALLGRMR